MTKRELFLSWAKEIKALGYRVFVCSDEHYNYGYVVDENERIGAFQMRYRSLSLSTVHKPNSQIGTGFMVVDSVNDITKDIIDLSFSISPNWAPRSARYVNKYESLSKFLESHKRIEEL